MNASHKQAKDKKRRERLVRAHTSVFNRVEAVLAQHDGVFNGTNEEYSALLTLQNRDHEMVERIRELDKRVL